VAVGLRKRGAAVGSTLALWLGNPTLNPAVLVFIVITLGWRWAALRFVVGTALIAAAAWVALRLTTGTGAPRSPVSAERDVPPAPRPETTFQTAATRPSCSPPGEPWGVAWLRSFGRLALWLTPEYLVMVALLGAARAFLFPAGLHLSAGVWTLVGVAVAGTLFVIPTAGEVPIVQAMLAAGAGAAPAGVLLLTLAPLSLPSLLMVGRVLPARVLAAAAVLTMIGGVAAGVAAHLFGL
jgi:uncharacterized membrane protein YraQ (UPF0718 family)